MYHRRRRATDWNSRVPDHHAPGREKFFNPTSQARRTQPRHRATDCVSQMSRHPETRRTRFQEGFNFSKKAFLVNPLNSHNVVVEQPVVEPIEREHESTDLLVFTERSKRPTHNQANWQAQCFSTHFPEDPNCKVCKLTKTTRAPCRNRSEARGDRIHPIYRKMW